ncbi:TPA: hypothetical protein TUX97_001756, partial [Streptococcus equi subsp. zooepidemicus]|nr:hypothetical protein [Streptococcus equi subsp. zooepidemicus]HEL0753680.1 hypothetical protein [Streptococcus equi subsp. zooepidemicus]
AAYEDYLYFLNKPAFDDYWKARSNYDGEWDLKNNKYAKEIEEDLGKKLQSSGINFRLIVNKMGDDILSVNVNAPYLSQVAGIAQVFSDKDFDKWLNSIKKGNYGDNEGDTQMIQAGIDGYVKRKKSK